MIRALDLGQADPHTRDRLERQAAFWRMENTDRPVIGFTGSYYAVGSLRSLRQHEGRLRPQDIDVGRVLDDCDAQFAAWSGCTGDLLWTATPWYGMRWFAAAIGAPVFCGGDSIWVEPFLRDYSNLDRLGIAEESEWIEALWGITDALVERASGRYPVAAYPFLGPLSILAEIRGSTELAYDLYDHPCEVKRAMGLLTETWGRLVTAHFRRLPGWHGGYTSSQRYIWAPGRVVEFNEDPAFMLSPHSHRQFVMPSHQQALGYGDYVYIHLHSTQVHTLDNLLQLKNLAAIELTPDRGESIADLIPTIRKVQHRKPVIVHGFLSAEEMRMIIEQVPPQGLCVISRVDTADAALRLQDSVLR